MGEHPPGQGEDYALRIESAFYFDLSSPLAYLVAERVLHVLPRPVEWQPVLARELPGAETFEAYRCETEEQVFRSDLERRADALELQPLRWPDPFPFDSELAMRAATYGKSIGRVVPFAQAAFRQAFAAGRSLADRDTVLIAAAACEMHPQAILRATELRSVRKQLAAATAQAARAGVSDVPAVRIGEQVFTGERALEDAAGHLGSTAGATLGAGGTAEMGPGRTGASVKRAVAQPPASAGTR